MLKLDNDEHDIKMVEQDDFMQNYMRVHSLKKVGPEEAANIETIMKYQEKYQLSDQNSVRGGSVIKHEDKDFHFEEDPAIRFESKLEEVQPEVQLR